MRCKPFSLRFFNPFLFPTITASKESIPTTLYKETSMMLARYKILVLIGIAACCIPLRYASAQSTLPCATCHADQIDLWHTSRHANTQMDVAGELAANWAGQTPDSVIDGSAAENCVACHSPLAVKAGGGLTEVQVMGHFFTTTGGVYTDSTKAADTANWPHLWCTTCHDVPDTHPTDLPWTSIFNSTGAHYDSIGTASTLCGQCHGTLRFSDTDHRIYDSWKLSKHGHKGHADVASELATSWSGKTPNDVINGPDAENCIACHAPTAVKKHNGDTTEVMVLSRYFTTTGGMFTDSTTVADTSHWPDVACATCHNPHKPDTLSYYNSTTRTYQAMGTSNELCGQCHGNLRFPGTDHLSYNIETGTGGVGVPDEVSMPGAKCVDCHMHKGETDGTNSLMYKGHRFSVFVDEPGGGITASCTSCHAAMSTDSAMTVVANYREEFGTLDSIAAVKVALADTFMQGITDTVKSRYLDEAHSNMGYAESDESGGFHNHKYTVALLNDAIAKATSVLTGVENHTIGLPLRFALAQNYPNPFNPSTLISYELPVESRVVLKIYNVLGQVIATLVQGVQTAGYKSVNWAGAQGATGVYLYRLDATSVHDPSRTFTQTKKMLLVR